MLRNIDLGNPHDKAEFRLGAMGSNDGGRSAHQYIKYNQGDNSVDAVAGYLIVGLDSEYEHYEGTADLPSTTIPALGNRPLGFANYAMTDGQFGWVQCWGPNKQTVLTGGGVDTQGEQIMAHASTAGAVDTLAGAATLAGIALETDASGTSLTAGQVDIRIRSDGPD